MINELCLITSGIKGRGDIMSIKMDLHIHSSASPDSLGDITTRIRRAKKAGLDIIAITDHNTINPKIRGKKIIEKDNVKLLVGEEISTDKGEVIGLFLKKPIKQGKLEYVLDEIKSQEAIAVLPHPFKRSRIVHYPEFLKDIDLIEVWNGRTSFEENYKALIFANLNKKYISCGSDAHFPFEVGRSILELPIDDKEKLNLIESVDDFLELIKNTQRYLIRGKSKYCFLLESLSQFVKFMKNRKKEALKNSLIFALYELVFGEMNNKKYFEIELYGREIRFK